MQGLLSRLRALGRRADLDRDLREQFAAHLDEATDAYIQQGLSPDAARRAARLDFGSVAGAVEACRDARGRWFGDLSADVRYGLRTLRRTPGFAAIAVLSLAMGIGANTAIFSVVNALMFRPRSVADPDRIVELFVGDRSHPYETTSYPSYIDLRDRNEVLTGLAGYGIVQFTLAAGDDVEQVWGEAVSANYFDVLGVRPLTGRLLHDRDGTASAAAPVAVIGHGLWQRRFNGDPDVVGKTITLNRQKLTVVGVVPARYTGMFRGLSSEVWVPAGVLPLIDPANGPARLTSRGSRWLVLVGRLAPGVTLEQARARFDLLSREMQADHPREWRAWQEHEGYIRELFVTVFPERATRIHPEMHGAAYAVAALLGVVVNLVLAIACMNLASMLLARAVVRRREIAIRLAMGAGRLRIIRQLVTESILLSLVAGIAGVGLTVWLLDMLVAMMPAFPEGIRIALDLRPDWRVFAYGIAFSTVTGVLFGLAPALKSSRTQVSAVLKGDSSTVAGDRRSRVRAALVVAQVGFAVLLLVGAGLVLRSLQKVQPTSLGFSSENVVMASLRLDEVQYDRPGRQDFYRRITERVASLPGVHAVSMIDGIPGGFLSGARRGTQIEGYEFAPGESREIDAAFVGPRYFTNMNIPVVQGRDFTDHDREGAPCVAIVNEAFATRYLAGGSVLGRHLTKLEYTAGKTTTTHCQIVGVVRDDRFQSLRESPRPFHALAAMQSGRPFMTMLVHTNGDPATLVGAVRHAIRALDPHLPVNDVRTLRDNFSAMAYPFRLLGVVMIACGVMALLLAAIGIYGIVAYSVAQRTREVGIRMALGALRPRIVGMLVGQGMTLVASGLGIGLILSLALTRVLTSDLFGTGLLFGVTATDSLTFAAVTIALAAVALAASSVPALRATRIDPVEALRHE
jgi:predicted permease